MNDRGTIANDFRRESHRIDQRIWDAMALKSGESVLFCGYDNDTEWIVRAVEIGCTVSVIASNENAIREHAKLRVNVLKGSTTMIPAKDATFDAAVAFHYLHEVDPFFHANVVSELARVGKRLIIVEPAPPTDPLGLRISMLYSRAKRELGQFEYYQNVDYWRKLVSIVKADVTQATFAFTRTPPRYAIKDTVALILDTMAVEQTPEPYLAELRALAQRPDAQLVPQARYVLVGAAEGAVPAVGAGTMFRERTELDADPEPVPVPRAPAVPVAPVRPTVYATPPEAEMPPLLAPAAPPGPPAFIPPQLNAPTPPVAPAAAGFTGFGVPPPAMTAPEPNAPFAMPFAVPPEPAETPFGVPSGLGWEWEPPEPAAGPDDAKPEGSV